MDNPILIGKINLPRIKGKNSLQTRKPHLQDLSHLQDSYNIFNWFSCRFRLKKFSSRALAAPLIIGVEPFVTILVECIMRNNSVKLFWISTSVSGGDVAYWEGSK